MIRARRNARPGRRISALAVFVAAASLAVPTGVAAAAPSGVDPANLSMRLYPGESAPIVDGAGVGTIRDGDRSGVFTCTATAINVLGATPSVANPGNVPCADDNKTTAGAELNAGLINIQTSLLVSWTNQTPDDLSAPPATGDAAVSTAKLSYTKISTLGLQIVLGVIQAQASATCDGDAPNYGGISNIASLTINGMHITVGSEPLTIPLVIGTLRLNSTQISDGQVVQQAVVLDTVLGHIVIAEAQAGVHGTSDPDGNPCR
jgi:hypothetical protein